MKALVGAFRRILCDCTTSTINRFAALLLTGCGGDINPADLCKVVHSLHWARVQAAGQGADPNHGACSTAALQQQTAANQHPQHTSHSCSVRLQIPGHILVLVKESVLEAETGRGFYDTCTPRVCVYL